MGFWKKLGKGILNVASAIIPGGGIVKSVVEATGVLNESAPVIDVPAYELGSMAKVSSSGSSMMLPVSSGGLPALAGMQTAAAQSQGPGGLPVPFWKGAGGKLQMPWNDPRIPEFLKQFALDDAYLRQTVRAPRGFVVVRDGEGRPFAVQREIAIKFGIWKPATKPLLTSTDVRALRRADRLEKRIKTIAKKYGPKVRVVHEKAKSKRR